MSIDKIVDLTSFLCKVALDVYWLRQQTIANNIANVDTPGYKRQIVPFESKLQHILKDRKISNPKEGRALFFDIQSLVPELVVEHDTSYRADLNNVDIDEEVVALRRNAVMYEVVLRRLMGKYKIIDIVTRVIR